MRNLIIAAQFYIFDVGWQHPLVGQALQLKELDKILTLQFVIALAVKIAEEFLLYIYGVDRYSGFDMGQLIGGTGSVG